MRPQPHFFAMRAAALSPRSRIARPPRKSTAFAPLLRNSSADAFTALSGASSTLPGWSGFEAPPAGSHWQFDGTISVAICPGYWRAAAIASAMSGAAALALFTSRIHADTLCASDMISDVSGASAARCHVAWSPIILTTGDRARRALCRFAIPLAKPGPRCVSVSAGLSAIRA